MALRSALDEDSGKILIESSAQCKNLNVGERMLIDLHEVEAPRYALEGLKKREERINLKEEFSIAHQEERQSAIQARLLTLASVLLFFADIATGTAVILSVTG